MKSRWNYLIIASFAIILYGCPYSSSYSLSPEKKVEANFLVGRWEAPDATDHYITVSSSDGENFDITKSFVSDGTETIYHGYFSDVSGTLFLNTWEDGGDGTYYFHKVDKMGGNKIVVYEVSENIRETFSSSQDIFQFFKGNMANSYFYNTGELTYYKVE